jgi:RNA polymerase sigma factor for flagellar operon FliA
LDYQQLLIQHLEVIDRLVRFVARRHHLSLADTEEFASLVRLRLVEGDFAILRKFEHRSSLNTYLAVVIERICLDFCVAKWGKWRPSAAAKRLGPVAILLEHLILHDGITFDEAVGTLQTNHGVSETRAELHEMLLQLPVRAGKRCVGPLDADSPMSAAVDGAFDHRDEEHVVEQVQTALMEAFASLSPQDRRIVQLRFDEGRAVVDIARALGSPVKPLYRRLARIIDLLRAELLNRGVDEAAIGMIIGHPRLALDGVLAKSSRRSSQ